MTTSDGTVGRYLGWFLVALSLGAGVIHFAHAGEHYDIGWAHGTFFAVVAWLQLVWAAAIVVRPTRRLLALGAIGNVLVIVTWTMSRIWGVPIGPDRWDAEQVGLSDALATGFEVGIVVICAAVLLRPALAQASLKPRLGLAGIGTSTLAIAVVSTMALSPSFATEHSHGDEEASHSNGTETSHDEESADHAHGAAADDAAAMEMTPEEHAAMDDEAMEDTGDTAESHEGYAITADGTTPCELSGIANEGNAGGSGHGHRGPSPWTPLTPEEQGAFNEEMRQANEAVRLHPTVADAEADGYSLVTGYVPCIAAHYIDYTAFADGFNPARPEVILYAGTEPDSEVVGLSYLQLGDPEAVPQGFTGGNDGWHIHSSLCINRNGQVVGDESTSEADCQARGGNTRDTARVWMNHTWNAPGWPSSWGMFSGENPLLGGTFGNINAEPDQDD